VVPPAESGHPETAAEFARRVQDRFILHGPGERKKGGKGDDAHPPTLQTHQDTTEEDRFVPLAQLPDPEDDDKTLEDIKGQYHLDPFFQKVMDSPKHFHNFEVNEGIICIRLNDRVLLCIPDVKVDGRRL
jgi:hypothetical protein